jgi:hypothetical protein
MDAVSARRRGLYGKLKREVGEAVANQSLGPGGYTSEKNYRRLLPVFSRLAGTEHQRLIAGWLWDGSRGATFLSGLLKGVHPGVLRGYLAKMIAGPFFRDQEVHERMRAHDARREKMMSAAPRWRSGCARKNG